MREVLYKRQGSLWPDYQSRFIWLCFNDAHHSQPAQSVSMKHNALPTVVVCFLISYLSGSIPAAAPCSPTREARDSHGGTLTASVTFLNRAPSWWKRFMWRSNTLWTQTVHRPIAACTHAPVRMKRLLQGNIGDNRLKFMAHLGRVRKCRTAVAWHPEHCRQVHSNSEGWGKVLCEYQWTSVIGHTNTTVYWLWSRIGGQLSTTGGGPRTSGSAPPPGRPCHRSF